MRTLVVRAGLLPVFAAVPALLLAFCVEWQARLARSAVTEALFGGSGFAPIEFRLASPLPGDAQIPVMRGPQAGEPEPGVTAEGEPATAPSAHPRASFAERFAAAFAYYTDGENGEPVEVAVEIESAPDPTAVPPERDDESRYEGHTAVYVIATHTVFLPGGERLEAHSGLGGNIDNPRRVSVRNRGATPPNVYNLVMRARRFHGVRAIRLVPVDQTKMFGRSGMLAHTYMLGPSGQSNGCVVFRNYPAFLNAFLRGEVRRLIVVDRLEAVANLKPGDKPQTLWKVAQGQGGAGY
jgi:hypothetical protein